MDLFVFASVSWGLAQNGAAEVPVLGFHEHVGHPMVIVQASITEGSDTELVSNETSSEGCTSKHHPLYGFKLSATEVSSHTGAGHEQSSSAATSESHSKGKCVPAAFSCEELILVKEETVWRFNDLICSLILRSVITPSVGEGSVHELSTFPYGTSKHAWHFDFSLITNNYKIEPKLFLKKPKTTQCTLPSKSFNTKSKVLSVKF